MRTLLAFAPALLCMGTMFFCLRLMARRHVKSTSSDGVTDSVAEHQSDSPAGSQWDREDR
jgi:hypothetical protein